MGESDRGKQHSGNAKLLAHIEPVHVGAAPETLLREAHDHRLPPVRFGDVEPELSEPFDQRGRRLERNPESAKVPRILERSKESDPDGHRDHPRLERIGGSGTTVEHDKRGEGGQQQNHAQVIAEPKRKDGVEDGEFAGRRAVGP